MENPVHAHDHQWTPLPSTLGVLRERCFVVGCETKRRRLAQSSVWTLLCGRCDTILMGDQTAGPCRRCASIRGTRDQQPEASTSTEVDRLRALMRAIVQKVPAYGSDGRCRLCGRPRIEEHAEGCAWLDVEAEARKAGDMGPQNK